MISPFLVGGIPTPLKHMKVSWDDYSQYMESHKKCSKPASRFIIPVISIYPISGMSTSIEITSDFTISGWWYTYPSETYESQLG